MRVPRLQRLYEFHSHFDRVGNNGTKTVSLSLVSIFWSLSLNENLRENAMINSWTVYSVIWLTHEWYDRLNEFICILANNLFFSFIYWEKFDNFVRNRCVWPYWTLTRRWYKILAFANEMPKIRSTQNENSKATAVWLWDVPSDSTNNFHWQIVFHWRNLSSHNE